MITATTSWLEFVATLFVALAILLKGIDLYDCYLDLQAAQTDRRWETQFIARGNLRTAILHLLVKVVMLAYVLLAAATPPANPARPISTLAVVLYGGFLLMAALLLAATWFQRSDRRALLVRLSMSGPSPSLISRITSLEETLRQMQLRDGDKRDG